MKYTAEKVRDYADACRLAHKGPVIADMLTELAERIKADEAKFLGTCPKHGVEYVGECSGCAMTLPEKDFTHPPAQTAQVDAFADRLRQSIMRDTFQPTAEPVAQSEVFVQVLASLIAAVRLLRSGGRKAAPSDTMFAFMLADYEKAIKAGRDLLATQQPREPS